MLRRENDSRRPDWGTWMSPNDMPAATAAPPTAATEYTIALLRRAQLPSSRGATLGHPAARRRHPGLPAAGVVTPVAQAQLALIAAISAAPIMTFFHWFGRHIRWFDDQIHTQLICPMLITWTPSSR
jgi:hypothetical protein